MAKFANYISIYIGYFIMMIAGVLLTYHGVSTDKGNLIVTGCTCIFISLIIPVILFIADSLVPTDDDYEPCE